MTVTEREDVIWQAMQASADAQGGYGVAWVLALMGVASQILDEAPAALRTRFAQSMVQAFQEVVDQSPKSHIH